MKRACLIIISICLASVVCKAQVVSEKALYLKEAQEFSLLYQGKLEIGYRRGYVNTPYFPQEYVKGKVVYEGMVYTDVPLRLDCYTKRVVMQAPNKIYHIELLPEITPRVTIGNRDYVYFNMVDKAPDATYFAALYETEGWGIYKLHYINNVNQDLEQGKVRKEFSVKHKVFLKKGKNWTELGGKDDFIKQFKNHKEELKNFCKNENIRPNVKRENDWVKLARYCETLVK